MAHAGSCKDRAAKAEHGEPDAGILVIFSENGVPASGHGIRKANGELAGCNGSAAIAEPPVRGAPQHANGQIEFIEALLKQFDVIGQGEAVEFAPTGGIFKNDGDCACERERRDLVEVDLSRSCVNGLDQRAIGIDFDPRWPVERKTAPTSGPNIAQGLDLVITATERDAQNFDIAGKDWQIRDEIAGGDPQRCAFKILEGNDSVSRSNRPDPGPRRFRVPP